MLPHPQRAPNIQAIVVLQQAANSMEVADTAISLYNLGYKVPIIVTGNFSERVKELNSYYPSDLANHIELLTMQEVVIESNSMHTRAQAENICPILKEMNVTEAALVCSATHAPRALLTFMKYCPGISWHLYTSPPFGSAKEEFEKIVAYGIYENNVNLGIDKMKTIL